MKSGTTSLFKYLSTHPEILACEKKEPHFFSKHYATPGAQSQYLKMFEGVGGQKYLLEASTSYTKFPVYEGVAERIHALSPDARIIYLMRDPFERIVSQYRHAVAVLSESRNLTELVKTDIEYLGFSHYSQQLRPYLSIFGRENVYPCTFESMTEDPRGFCEHLFRWLDIATTSAETIYEHAYNQTRERYKTLDESRYWGRMALRFKRSKLVQYIPQPWRKRKIARSLFPYKTARDTASESLSRDTDSARELLTPLLSSWTRELEEDVALSFPQWKSVQPGQDSGREIAPELHALSSQFTATTAGCGRL